MQSKSSLRCRRIHYFIELWCLVGSRGLEIWVSSNSFQKSNISWPEQPPTKRVSNISIFFWDEMRLSRSLRPLRFLSCKGHICKLQTFYGLENHYWGLHCHPGSWIQLYFDVVKKHFLVESRNATLNFSTFFVGGCWGQPMLLFCKLVDESQISQPPKPTT